MNDMALPAGSRQRMRPAQGGPHMAGLDRGGGLQEDRNNAAAAHTDRAWMPDSMRPGGGEAGGKLV